jgi:hypothetical protein
VRSRLPFLLPVLLFSFCLSTIAAAAPATAPTPLMGSHSGSHFEQSVTDQNIRDTADAMVASGPWSIACI